MSTTSLRWAVLLCFVGLVHPSASPPSATKAAETGATKTQASTVFVLGQVNYWSWKALGDYTYTDALGLVRTTNDSSDSPLLAAGHSRKVGTTPVDMAPPFPPEIATRETVRTVDAKGVFVLGQVNYWSWRGLRDYTYSDDRGLARRPGNEEGQR